MEILQKLCYRIERTKRTKKKWFRYVFRVWHKWWWEKHCCREHCVDDVCLRLWSDHRDCIVIFGAVFVLQTKKEGFQEIKPTRLCPFSGWYAWQLGAKLVYIILKQWLKRKTKYLCFANVLCHVTGIKCYQKSFVCDGIFLSGRHLISVDASLSAEIIRHLQNSVHSNYNTLFCITDIVCVYWVLMLPCNP